MSITENGTISPEVRAAIDEAVRHAMTGQGDPKVLAWIHEQAARIREEILRQHGVLDIGVSAIRELRGELPDS
jgi:hypothetical protein